MELVIELESGLDVGQDRMERYCSVAGWPAFEGFFKVYMRAAVK